MASGQLGAGTQCNEPGKEPAGESDVTCTAAFSCFRTAQAGGGKQDKTPRGEERLHPPVSCVLPLLAHPISLSASSIRCSALPSSLSFPVMSCQAQRWDLALLCTEINGISSACLRWTCWISSRVYSCSASLASGGHPDACRSQPAFGKRFSFYP